MDKIEDREIKTLVNIVYEIFGHDFRDYAETSLKRRIRKAVQDENLKTVSGLQERVLHQPGCFERLLLNLTVNVTEMFRDPGFFTSFRKDVVPYLKTYPFIRLWCAGCSAGQEVYSIAILLEEEGLYRKTQIYATDLDEVVLEKAKEGIYPLDKMKEYTSSYIKAGGTASFSDYYTAKYGNAVMEPSLKENIVWASHNLATDCSFNEFHIITCRNVMIYFNKTLQERVHRLIYESLVTFGFLGLGTSESPDLTPYEKCYKAVSGTNRIYRKVK